MRTMLSLALGLCLSLAAAAAQSPPAGGFTFAPAAALSQSGAIALDGALDFSGEVWNQIPGSRIVRNVTHPALIPFPAAAGKTTGAAVIIAPGGGFMFLSMDSEGYDVARWLAKRGITCFVLKYRLEPTPADTGEMQRAMMAMFTRPRDTASGLPGEPRAVEDGLAAMRYVRTHAADWKLDPDRIGFMGFSAGGMTTSGVATRYDDASRPAFAGIIYGSLKDGATVPSDAPPAFILVAADDPLLANASYPAFSGWQAAKRPAELHILQRGGHGFGMKPTNTSVDHWIDNFYWWLDTNGFLKARGASR
jgi:acetyl esterase/lipase